MKKTVQNPSEPPETEEIAQTPGNRRRFWLAKLIKSPRKRRKRLVGAAMLSVLVLGGFSVVRRSPQTDRPEVVSSLPIETIAIDLVTSYDVSRDYTGEVEALQTSELSFERSGLVVSLLVEEGDFVEAGVAIAQLDTSQLETQRLELLARRAQAGAVLAELQAGPRIEAIETARASLAQETAALAELQAGPRTETIEIARANLAQETAALAELKAGPREETIEAARARVADIEEQLELARLQAERRKNLYSGGAISREQFDEAATAAEALYARRDAARSELDELETGTRIEQINAQRARVSATRSQLDELETGTRIEQINAQRARVSAARSQLDELETGTRIEQIDAQDAVVQQLDAQIADIDIRLEKSTIDAPFSGIVSDRLLDEGTVILAAQPVVRLVESGRPEVRVGVPVDVAATIALDSRQSVRVGDIAYDADVVSVLPEVDPATRTQTVILALDSSVATTLDTDVAIGAVARLELNQSSTIEGYWLPSTALVKGDRGLWTCYVAVDDAAVSSERIEPRPVEVIHTEGDRVLVRGTLSPGDNVVADGVHRLVPGQLVRSVDL
ncbi:MAG: efflux RND transporter periplasmic adaptor subunit [Geitlerinemataceae cyanobacterium]